MVLVVFLVAGLSSRYGQHEKFTGFESNNELLSKLKQFAVLQVGSGEKKQQSTTFIEYSVRQALSTPFEAIVFITNPMTESLFQSTFGSSIYCLSNETSESVPVFYVPQTHPNYRQKPYGSADAVATLVHFLEDHRIYQESPLVIVNGDDLYGADTYQEMHKLVSCGVNIIGTLPFHQTVLDETSVVNRGVVHLERILDNDLAITQVSEMKEFYNISLSTHPELKDVQTNLNCIGIQPCVLFSIKEHVDLGIEADRKDEMREESQVEFVLVDTLNQIIQAHDLTMYQVTLKHPICGITSMEDIERVEKFIQSCRKD